MKRIISILLLLTNYTVSAQMQIPNDGSAGQVLTFNAPYSISWLNSSSPLIFNSPLSVTTNTVSISQSTTSTDGYLNSTDWNIFNNKGTVTSIDGNAGAGISLSGLPITGSGTFTITNTAPDQTVTIASGNDITIGGSYPTFTVTSTASGNNITNANLSLDAARTVTLTAANSLTFTGGQTTFKGSGATSATDWIRGENSSGDKMMVGHDNGRINFGKYSTELAGNELRHHFIGPQGRTSLATLNFSNFVIENNVNTEIVLLTNIDDICTFNMNTSSGQFSFMRCDFSREAFEFLNNGTYFMSNYDTELLTVMGVATQNLSVADNSTIGLLLKDIDLQLFRGDATSGSTTRDSPEFLFRSTSWDGGASVTKNDHIKVIAVNTSADTKMSFNVGGTEKLAIESGGDVIINSGDFIFSTLGDAISIPSGSNGRAGNATLVAGTITVTNNSVTANTIILLTKKTNGGSIGTITYTLNAGTSFTITSDSGTDTSTYSYLLIENP
ncbi:MAG: hypothetical protein ACUZ8H_16110 [Candidatus Anammoxibacter sp.]